MSFQLLTRVLIATLAGVALAIAHAAHLAYTAPNPAGCKAGAPFLLTTDSLRLIVVPAASFGLQQYDVTPKLDGWNHPLGAGMAPKWVWRPPLGQSGITRGFGWPCVALSGTEVFAGRSLIGTPGYRSLSEATLIPTQVQPGLALNALLLASGCFVALSVARLAFNSVVRRHRRNRGKCTGCGYILKDLADRPCPECGAPAEITR
jgi:hypothetical protein